MFHFYVSLEEELFNPLSSVGIVRYFGSDLGTLRIQDTFTFSVVGSFGQDLHSDYIQSCSTIYGIIFTHNLILSLCHLHHEGRTVKIVETVKRTSSI